MLYTYEIMYEKTIVQIFQHDAVYVLDFFDGERIVMDCDNDESWKLYMQEVENATSLFGETDAVNIISLLMQKKTKLLLHPN